MSCILTAVILGLVEGLTEFLPISSTGHLIVAGHLLGFQGEVAHTFDVFIQGGAILAVVVYYRAWLSATVSNAVGRASAGARDVKKDRRTLLGLCLAVLPALIVGGTLHGLIKGTLFQPLTVAAGLLVGGVAIFVVERWRPAERVFDPSQVTLKQALIIGAGQCLAMWPGVSRSGATILSGLCLGLDHRTAAAYSFLLSIPTMTAAVCYDLMKSWHSLSDWDLAVMGVGFVVSFAVALGVIACFLRFLKAHTLNVFGGYRIIVGFIIVWMHL